MIFINAVLCGTEPQKERWEGGGGGEVRRRAGEGVKWSRGKLSMWNFCMTQFQNFDNIQDEI